MRKYGLIFLGSAVVVMITAVVLSIKSVAAGTTAVGFISRPSEAADLRGDNNGIGRFNSNEANKNLIKVFGKVTELSDTEITIMSKRDPDNGTTVETGTSYTFMIDDTTKVLRRFRAASSVAEMAVGDHVRLWSTALTDGTAKLIWDKSIWWVRMNGTISNLDAVNKTFTLLITRMSSNDTPKTFAVKVKTNDMTIYANADGTPATWADLTDGDQVRVRGVWNHVGRYLTARNVKFL